MISHPCQFRHAAGVLARGVELGIALGVGCLNLGATQGESREAIRAGWGAYDPNIRRAHLEAQAARKESVAVRKTTKPETGQSPPQTPATDGTKLILPDMVVTAEPAVSLPRSHVPKPARQLEAEPFESPEARRARLVRKHFTELEQVLSLGRLPLFNHALLRRAVSKEAGESSARQLNHIAYLIELSDLAGLDSPEERGKLISEYLKALQMRPR